MLSQVPSEIQRKISALLTCTIDAFEFSSGGCINSGGRLATSRGVYFLKWNSVLKYPGMFSAEANGLILLGSTSTVKTPEVFLTGEAENFQFLLLEFIEKAPPSAGSWKKLGEQLSEMHQTTTSSYGLDFNNYIGSLPQHNSRHKSWITFFIEERLRPQLELAIRRGQIQKPNVAKFEKLVEKLPGLIVEEKPALLHGDLWSGNVIVDKNGNPCLIDPAVFYGNREAEIAFTQLFGGFQKAFYDSYNSNFPLENAFDSRADIYNLYPLLVHLNLFGGGYLNQVVSILRHYV